MKKEVLPSPEHVIPQVARTGAAVGLAVDPTPESGGKLNTLREDIAKLQKANADYYGSLMQKPAPFTLAETKWLVCYERDMERMRDPKEVRKLAGKIN